MPSTIRPRLTAMFGGADARVAPGEAPEWLRTYRVYCLLTAVFIPLLGLAVRSSSPDAVDPFWVRGLMSGLFMGLAAASYGSARAARRLNHLVHGAFFVLTFWIAVLAVVNQFSADYSVGLVFGVAATSLALSFVPSARLPLLWYQIVMTAVVTGAALLTPERETGRIILVSCLAGIAFVTDVAATIRMRLEEDRERYRDNLISANERAEEMLRLKAAFINNMNHEIRTPLTGIIGFAEIIAETTGSEQQSYALVIQEAGRRLMDTLTGILDLAHLESGNFAVALDTVDVNAALREVVSLLENRALHRELTLEVTFAPVPVPARADHTAVCRIVYNLLSNAIKFTDEGGRIGVTSTVDDEAALIRVEDTGIGIDAVFLPYIFDEFKQASSGVDRSHEGTGIGLTVTKRLVELMDGSITVTTAPGEGSTFTVALPLAAARGSFAGEPVRATKPAVS